VAENAGRAVAVVYGTVTASDAAALTVRVGRALKGQVANPVRVFAGPSRVGGPGTAVATSVDYTAAVGSEHVLYLIRGADGQLETNACIGSHAGPPDAAELAFFGAGSASSAAPQASVAPATDAPATPVPAPATPLPATGPWAVLVLAILGGAALVVLRRARGEIRSGA
jgi:hypothetical protein